MLSKFDIVSLGAHCFTAYMFPETQIDVLISAGLGFVPRILEKGIAFLNRKFKPDRETYNGLCYASAFINMTTLYKASSLCLNFADLHLANKIIDSSANKIIDSSANKIIDSSVNILNWYHSIISNIHYINAYSIQVRLIAETSCVIGAGIFYPMVQIYLKPIRDFFVEYEHTDQILETILNINNSIRDNRAFTVSYDNYVLYSTPNIRDTISESDLDSVAPLRFPGNQNADRPPEQQTEYSVPESCIVCTEDYSEQQLTRTLPCGHSFHAYCVDDWLLRRSANCPMCRKPIKVEKVD
jgi:hypothetical protein